MAQPGLMSKSKTRRGPIPLSRLVLFERHAEKRNDTDHWMWHGALSPTGYGYFNQRINGKQKGMHAHRVAWELFCGEIPVELQVLHRCDVRACVNPSHLFLGTQSENMQDAISKKRWTSPWLLPHLRQGMIMRLKAEFKNGGRQLLQDSKTGRILGTKRT